MSCSIGLNRQHIAISTDLTTNASALVMIHSDNCCQIIVDLDVYT